MADQYVCTQCGMPGVVDPGFTLVDARYATGRCTGIHVGPQYLVRADVRKVTQKPKRGTKIK